MSSRSVLTWDNGRGGRSSLTDRPGRALLMEKAAWAQVVGRAPLLDGAPPFTSAAEARVYLERRAADATFGGSVRRLLARADMRADG